MKTINGQAIGDRLKSLRGNKSQKEVADALGVTPVAISQYERGERIPNDDMKIAIAKYFRKSVATIFFN